MFLVDVFNINIIHRSQKYRDKAKEEGTTKKRTVNVLTKSMQKRKRGYWKKKKAESRQRMSAQKARRVKEYDRNRHTEETLVEEEKHETEKLQSRVRTARRKLKLPKDPELAARVLNHSIQFSTPRKKKWLDKLTCKRKTSKRDKAMIELLNSLKEKKKKDKSKVIKDLLQKKKVSNKKQMSLLLGVRYRWLTRVCSLTEENLAEDGRKLDKNTVEEVKDFYMRPDISVCLPDKKYATKEGPRYVLKRNLEKAYSEFEGLYPGKVKRSKFIALRPRNVKTVNQHHWVKCVCPKCANVALHIKILNRLFGAKLCDKYDLVEKMLCKRKKVQKRNKKRNEKGNEKEDDEGNEKEDDEGNEKEDDEGNDEKVFKDDFHASDCLKNQCSDCGVDKFLSTFNYDSDRVIEFTRWENIKEENGKSKMGLKLYRETLEVFFKLVEGDLKNFGNHLFTASWQYRQLALLKENLLPEDLITIVDYGENFRHEYQDEVAAMHWQYQQSTIHPVVCLYRDPLTQQLVHLDVIIISSDLQHDYLAAEEYCTQALNYVKSESGIDFKHIYRFSDTCTGQYRSRNVFNKLAEKSLPHTYVYFGANHGKGPADGAIANVKRITTTDIKAGNVQIRNSEEWYNSCTENYSIDDGKYKRTFFFFKKDDVDHSSDVQVDPVPGTMLIQCVRNGDEEKAIHTRNLACFCQYCYKGLKEKCDNDEHVLKWEVKAITTKEDEKKKKNPKTGVKRPGKNEEKDSTSEEIQPKRRLTRQSINESTVPEDIASNESKRNTRSTRQRTSINLPEDGASKEIKRNTRSTSQNEKEEKPTIEKKSRTKGKKVQPVSKPEDRDSKETKPKTKLTSPNEKEEKPTIEQKSRAKENKVQSMLKSNDKINKPPNYSRYNPILPVLNSMNLLIDYMREDGNCFFRAVSKSVHGVEAYHADMRCMICDFITEFKSEFQQYINLEKDVDVEAHITRMTGEKIWAETAEIFAASAMLQRDIFVLTPMDTDLDCYKWLLFTKVTKVTRRKATKFAVKSKCQCHLTIVNTGGRHYDRVCDAEGNCNCGVPRPELEQQ